MDKKKMKEILVEIARDMKDDAAAFDGQPFTGKTVGTYMGYQGAAIAAIANILHEILEEQKL